MVDLTSVEGKKLETDEEKREGLCKDHFGWDKQGREVRETEEEGGDEGDDQMRGESLSQLEAEVRKALASTKNASAPGPDGISYRMIKAVQKTKLSEELVREVT